VVCDGAPAAIRMTGLGASLIQNVRFENISIRSTRGVLCSDVRNIVFNNVHVTAREGPVFALTNAANVVLQRCAAPEATDVFLQLAGPRSRVMIEQSDLSAANRAFVTLGEVSQDAVEIRSPVIP
jgi:hypothetical protein